MSVKHTNTHGHYIQTLIHFLRFTVVRRSTVLTVHHGHDYFSPYLEAFKYTSVHWSRIQTVPAHAFDYIIISDTLSVAEDVQQLFFQLKQYVGPETRIIITFRTFLWKKNWLTANDIHNLLELEGYQTIQTGKKTLGGIHFIIARPRIMSPKDMSVSIVIPARNEKGNIEPLVRRLPKFGKHREIIFVEGHSKDGTWPEIQRVKREYPGMDIHAYKQQGIGKADAMRKGFSKATGDVLMILDADLSVSPEDLPKFYDAIAQGKGEYINGSRLVYPVEKEAMRFLNMLGNQFFSVVLSWILNQNIKDTLCGTKVLSRKNYERIAKNRRYFGDFDPFGDFDLLFGAAKLNLKFIEVPVRYHAREYGQTNISRFRHGWMLLKMTVFGFYKMKCF